MFAGRVYRGKYWYKCKCKDKDKDKVLSVCAGRVYWGKGRRDRRRVEAYWRIVLRLDHPLVMRMMVIVIVMILRGTIWPLILRGTNWPSIKHMRLEQSNLKDHLDDETHWNLKSIAFLPCKTFLTYSTKNRVQCNTNSQAKWIWQNFPFLLSPSTSQFSRGEI